MDNIFNTDKCILVYYPPGASGKFLINCLCLNEEFVPLIQVENHYDDLSSEQKQQEFLFSLLVNHTAEEGSFVWSDFNTSDNIFYQVNSIKTNTSAYQTLQELSRSVSLRYAIHNNKYFFKNAHNEMEMAFFKYVVWKNATLMKFTNIKEWVDKRNDNTNSIIKYNSIPKYDDSGLGADVTFDVSSLLNRDAYICEYKKLLSFFNVKEKNVDKVIQFYDIYKPYILGENDMKRGKR